MSDWLDNFQMMGAKLNEGEKSLMRFAMRKERERIIELLESKRPMTDERGKTYFAPFDSLIAIIKGENK